MPWSDAALLWRQRRAMLPGLRAALRSRAVIVCSGAEDAASPARLRSCVLPDGDVVTSLHGPWLERTGPEELHAALAAHRQALDDALAPVAAAAAGLRLAMQAGLALSAAAAAWALLRAEAAQLLPMLALAPLPTAAALAGRAAALRWLRGQLRLG